MKLGFSGSRHGMTREQKDFVVDYLLKNLDNIEEVHHGDCVGSDEQFHKIAKSYNIKIIIHPPNNYSKRAFCSGSIILEEQDYLKRDEEIAKSCDVLIATPSADSFRQVIRSGTWYTINKAKEFNKKIIIVKPDGEPIFINFKKGTNL